jgi:L-alanine-DL-glutamate epimerase-like enolase superfamily enzyme
MPKIARVATSTVQANFPWHYVRIYTDDSAGLYGTGECFLTPGFEAITESLTPLLVGEDIESPKRILEKLKSATSGTGSTGGIIWNVITGIEAALLDAFGKLRGVPIYSLLGGAFRQTVPVYVDCHGGESLEALSEVLQPITPNWATKSHGATDVSASAIERAAANATQIVGEGYDFLKFDLDVPGSTFDSSVGYGLGAKELNWMVELVYKVREAVGPQISLSFDAHWRYRTNDMLVLARELENARLAWLEDPVPPSDMRGLSYLRSKTSTPIATGENTQLKEGFYDLLRHEACDIVTPDCQKAGGLYEASVIAAIAAMHNRDVAPHMIGSPLAMRATAHFAASIPNLLAVEFHGHDVPFYGEMVEPAFESWFKPGAIALTSTPGLGIELRRDVMAKYLRDGSEAFDE